MLFRKWPRPVCLLLLRPPTLSLLSITQFCPCLALGRACRPRLLVTRSGDSRARRSKFFFFQPTPGVFETPARSSVVRTSSYTPPPRPRFGPLHPHTRPAEPFSLSCHRPSYLSQQPGSLLAYLPHFKGKQARRFKKPSFSGRLAPPPPPAPGLSSNAVRLLNVCFPCLMTPVCVSQPLSPR